MDDWSYLSLFIGIFQNTVMKGEFLPTHFRETELRSRGANVGLGKINIVVVLEDSPNGVELGGWKPVETKFMRQLIVSRRLQAHVSRLAKDRPLGRCDGVFGDAFCAPLHGFMSQGRSPFDSTFFTAKTSHGVPVQTNMLP